MDRYEEALERANEAVKRGMVSQNFVDDIFGVESENERIRKNCIHFLKLQKAHHADTSEIDDCIAYLERHIEQKPIQYDIDVLEKHITKDSVSELAHTVIVRNGWEIVEKEQMPAEWSEEDERIRQCLIRSCEKELDDLRNDKYGHQEIVSDLKECYRERINWLKSLRPQPHWKPSEEQMDALDEYIWAKEPSKDKAKYVISLYKDLKKLM